MGLTREHSSIILANVANPLAQLGKAVTEPRVLARRAMQDPAWLQAIIGGLGADAARIKYGCAKALRLVSEDRPDLLYPRFDFFVSLLDGENKILQWQGLFVLSRLARVDTRDRVAAIFSKYFSSIRGPVMITAANAIQGGARIARAKPALAERIVGEILRVDKARYQTPECRNVAIGHAIVALGEILDLVTTPEPVVQFVRKQARNTRPATRKKAEQFLKKVERRAKNPAA